MDAGTHGATDTSTDIDLDTSSQTSSQFKDSAQQKLGFIEIVSSGGVDLDLEGEDSEEYTINPNKLWPMKDETDHKVSQRRNKEDQNWQKKDMVSAMLDQVESIFKSLKLMRSKLSEMESYEREARCVTRG